MGRPARRTATRSRRPPVSPSRQPVWKLREHAAGGIHRCRHRSPRRLGIRQRLRRPRPTGRTGGRLVSDGQRQRHELLRPQLQHGGQPLRGQPNRGCWRTQPQRRRRPWLRRDGYAGADYYGGYGDSAYQGGYPAPYAANGYTGGAVQGGQPDPASYQADGQFAGHYEQRAIAAPDLAYGHERHQGYPGYGGNGR